MPDMADTITDLRKRVTNALFGTVTDDIAANDAPWLGKVLITKTLDTLVDAVLGAVDDEAIERMAQHYVDETHIRALEIRDGAVLKLKPAQDMAALWVGTARTMLGDAENYSETEATLPSVSMDVKLAGEFETFTLTVQRAQKLTPHQARQRAERYRDDAQDLAKALFDMVREFVGDWDILGPGLSWETLPDWLTGEDQGRALWAHGADGTGIDGA